MESAAYITAKKASDSEYFAAVAHGKVKDAMRATGAVCALSEKVLVPELLDPEDDDIEDKAERVKALKEACLTAYEACVDAEKRSDIAAEKAAGADFHAQKMKTKVFDRYKKCFADELMKQDLKDALLNGMKYMEETAKLLRGYKEVKIEDPAVALDKIHILLTDMVRIADELDSNVEHARIVLESVGEQEAEFE